MASKAFLEKAYLAYFGRPVDKTGEAGYANTTEADVMAGFSGSAESKALYGETFGTSQINAIYNMLFNRDAEPAGLISYFNLVNTGKLSPAAAAMAILDGAQNADKIAVANKIAASAAFTTALDTTAEIIGYGTASAAASARAFLKSVGATVATDTAITAAVLSATTNTATTGQTFTLTPGVDTFDGTSGADFIRGVAGSALGTQDQTTLNSSDVLNGGAGADTLALLLNGGGYGGGATIRNIETLQIGTNDITRAQTFDYNVNAGGYEVTGTNTIVYDQITANETLNVNNVTPSATGDVLPTLKWDNEAGSVAGTIGATFREAGIAGTTTQLNIVLDDVNNGAMNIAAGVETFKITSQGSTANTLANSAFDDNGVGQNVDLLSGAGSAANDDNSLTKVIIDGAQAFGKAAGLVAATGLTDRTVGVDTGSGAASASNLVSVAATVLEVDATASTGGVNIRFTPRVNGAEVAQKFMGGEGNDYVEFEVGNVNATGGKGNDTFAFVNSGFNSTLTVADVLAGGEGVDTLQIGVNGSASAGQQTYNLDWTEFNNKTGIDVLDLRGNINTVTLSDTFVAASDAGLTVRTDKIVQTSATNSANPVTSTARQEDNSVNTINLTKLSAGRTVTIEGGSGSDRLVVNEQSMTASTVIRGGDNVGNNGGAAVAGDYDTITVIDNAVLSRGDLSGVSGVEAIALVKSDSVSSRQFSLEITQGFLTSNTLAADVAAATSTLTDTVFSIVTGAAGNSNTLTAGDTVTIDVSDLYVGGLVAGGVQTVVGLRMIDVSSIVASGATVTFRDASGVIATPAFATAAAVATADATIALGSAALAATATSTGISFTSGIGANASVLGTNLNDTFNLSQADTVTGGTGTDTVNLNAGSFGATVTMGAGVDTININTPVAGGVNVVTAIPAGSTINVTVNQAGSIAADILTAGASTFNVSALQGATFQVDNNFIHTVNATAGGTFQTSAVGQTFNGSGTVVYTVTGAAGVDTITFTGTGATTTTGGLGLDVITLNAANAAIDKVAFNDGVITTGIVAAADRDVVTGFNVANDVIQLDTAQVTVPFVALQAAATNAAVTTGTGTSSVLSLNFDLGGALNVVGATTDGSAIIANMTGVITTTASDAGYIVAYDAGNAYLYAYTNAAGVTLAANEITLIGTFNGVAVGTLGTANFAAAA